jgi:hypothetical protein
MPNSKLDYVPSRQDHVTIRKGQVLQAGRNVIGCGGPSFLGPLLEGRQAKICITDPLASRRASGRAICESGKSRDGIVEWAFYESVCDALELMRSVSAPGGLAFVFTDRRRMSDLFAARDKLDIPFVGLVPCMDTDTLFDTNAYGFFGVFQMRAARGRDKFQRKWERMRTAALSDHLSAKPVVMLSDILFDYTEPREVVIDPYMGDGSMLIAAAVTGRTFIGVDLDPRSVHVSARRWQHVMGKEVFDIKTGEPLDDLDLSPIQGGDRDA